MVSKIEWTQRAKQLRILWAFYIGINMTVVALIFLAPIHQPTHIQYIVLAAFLLFVNLIFYLNYRESWRDQLNTFNFLIVLGAKDPKENFAQYNLAISIVEEYLARNRISSTSSFEGHKFGGPYLPYSKVFELNTFNAKVKVKRDKLGRFTVIAQIIVGEVTDISERFLKKLIEDLRVEMVKTFPDNT